MKVYAIIVCAVAWLVAGCAEDRGGMSNQNGTQASPTYSDRDSKPMPAFGGPGVMGTGGVGTSGGPGR